MDPKESRQQAIREAKKGLILDAARRVFSERGFHHTGIEEIAREAGFSKPSLYNYYKDKEDIFLHLALREIDTLLQKMAQRRDDTVHVRNSIEGLIRAVFETFGDHFYFMLTMSHFPMATLCHHDSAAQLHKEFTSRLNQLLHAFTAVIANGREKGEIATEVSDENCARYISGMIKSVFVHWRFQEHMGDPEKEIASIMAFISRGVIARDTE
jgi:AcrR family transcriptional regulator